MSYILMAALLVGCAMETRPAITDQQAPGIHASIVAVRPVPASASQGITARLLGGAGGHPNDLAEFIVRTDEGRTLSVVQPADATLQPGTQALLTTGDHPMLKLVVRATPAGASREMSRQGKEAVLF